MSITKFQLILKLLIQNFLAYLYIFQAIFVKMTRFNLVSHITYKNNTADSLNKIIAFEIMVH